MFTTPSANLSEEEKIIFNLNYPCVLTLVPHHASNNNSSATTTPGEVPTASGVNFVCPSQLTRYAISVIFNLLPASISLTAPLFAHETADHHTTNKMVLVAENINTSNNSLQLPVGAMIIPHRWLESSTARRDMQNRRFRVEVKGEPLVLDTAQKKHQQADARNRLLKRLETELFDLDEKWRKYTSALRKEEEMQEGGGGGNKPTPDDDKRSKNNTNNNESSVFVSSKEIMEKMLPPNPFAGIKLVDDVALRNAALTKAEARKSPQPNTSSNNNNNPISDSGNNGKNNNKVSTDAAPPSSHVAKTRMMIGANISPSAVNNNLSQLISQHQNNNSSLPSSNQPVLQPVNGGEYHRSMFLQSNPRAAINATPSAIVSTNTKDDNNKNLPSSQQQHQATSVSSASTATMTKHQVPSSRIQQPITIDSPNQNNNNNNSSSLTGRRNSANVASTSTSSNLHNNKSGIMANLVTATNNRSALPSSTTTTTASNASSGKLPHFFASASGTKFTLPSISGGSKIPPPAMKMMTPTPPPSSSQKSNSNNNSSQQQDERLAKQLQEDEAKRRMEADLAFAQSLASGSSNARNNNSRNNNYNNNNNNSGDDDFKARPGESDEDFAKRLSRQFGGR